MTRYGTIGIHPTTSEAVNKLAKTTESTFAELWNLVKKLQLGEIW